MLLFVGLLRRPVGLQAGSTSWLSVAGLSTGRRPCPFPACPPHAPCRSVEFVLAIAVPRLLLPVDRSGCFGAHVLHKLVDEVGPSTSVIVVAKVGLDGRQEVIQLVPGVPADRALVVGLHKLAPLANVLPPAGRHQQLPHRHRHVQLHALLPLFSAPRHHGGSVQWCGKVTASSACQQRPLAAVSHQEWASPGLLVHQQRLPSTAAPAQLSLPQSATC